MLDLDSIREGLANDEFGVEYLPIIEVDSGRCVGAEALLRWHRPDGVVFPDKFIPLIENTPLSGLVTYWVIDRVAGEMGDWLRREDNVALHLNVPPEILGRGGLEYAAQKSGLSALKHKVVLEITERGLPDQLGLHALDLATRQGVRVALDDVTIDPANVLVLSRTRAKIIKIDKSVLLNGRRDGGTPDWAEALAVLLSATQLEVIVEGVETAEQLAMLRAAGVRLVQGFYFSRPLPAPGFLQYYETRQA
jgi:EAL domain-containing protein (putative c-di-GMP-specific phosphodiesterase class I)